MSPTLLSLTKSRRRRLPPHGYEGRRAEPCFTPSTAAPAVAPLPPLPDPAELDRLGIRFEQVGFSSSGPVRCYQHGHCLGNFLSREHAAPTLRRLAQQ